jgi:hypothetical protein
MGLQVHWRTSNVSLQVDPMAVVMRIFLRNDPMIATSLSLNGSKNAERQPQGVPRLLAVLVMILTLVNVSATVLMVGSWASMSTGMQELEWSMQDRLPGLAN